MQNNAIPIKNDPLALVMPTRLNRKPIVVCNLNQQELAYTCGASLIFWLPFTTLFGGIMFDSWFLGFGVSIIMIVISVYLVGRFLALYTRNKPENYHVQKLSWFFYTLRMTSKPWIQLDGTLTLGRTDKARKR